MFRSVFRRAATSAKEAVPNVMAQFSATNNQMTFVSHPGVMAIARITDMGGIARFIPHLTQENVNAIREFDEELAEKAQVALDNNIQTTWIELEYINEPGVLERMKLENKLMQQARDEINARAAGDYKPVKVVADGSYKPTLGYSPIGENIDIAAEQARAENQNFIEYWVQLERAKQKAAQKQ